MFWIRCELFKFTQSHQKNARNHNVNTLYKQSHKNIFFKYWKNNCQQHQNYFESLQIEISHDCFPIMKPSFCFVNVKFITIPATAMLLNFIEAMCWEKYKVSSLLF